MGDSLITAGILAVVALSEGVRRLAPGTLVLERHGLRGWRVARTFELGSGMHLLSWCLPLTTPLVLVDGERAALSDRRLSTRLRARVRRVHRDVALLRIVGMLVLVTLILGIPFGVRRYGGWGLIASFQLLFALCIAQTVATWIALMRAGAPPRAAGASAIKLMWPFAAPRAPQIVVEQVAAGSPPLLAARALLGDEELLRSLRPTVYDAVYRGSDSEILDQYRREDLQSFLAAPVATGGQPYCPRCATIYRTGTSACAECPDVALTAPSYS